MVDQDFHSRSVLLETGSFETDLARWEIHWYPPTYGFVMGTVLAPTLDPAN
jgi:hypothetical protein